MVQTLGWQPISSSASYALQAVLEIASRAPESVRANELAARLEVPSKYLSKVLNTLGHAGVLTSNRGPHGGFRLAVAPDQLRLIDVISPFDDVGGAPRCLLRGKACNGDDPCLAHRSWRGIALQVHEFFRTRTVAEVAAKAALS
jgi:Rrf2 family protein